MPLRNYGRLRALGNNSELLSLTQLPNLEFWASTKDAADIVSGGGTCSVWHERSGNSDINGLILNGSAGNTASTPDSAALSVFSGGAIDVRTRLTINVIQSQGIVSKFVNAGQKCWAVSFQNGGANSSIFFSVDGTALASMTSTVGHGVAAGTRVWFRQTLTFDNGAGGHDANFYVVADQTNEPTDAQWLAGKKGATVTTAGTITPFDGTDPVTIGGAVAGACNEGAISVYRSIIRNGVSGPVVFDMDFTTLARGATGPFTESSVNAASVTLNSSGATGARISGARDAFMGTVASQPAWDATALTLTGDGVNDYMKTAPFPLVQPEWVVLVGKQVSWTGNDALFDGNTVDSGELYQVTSTPKVALDAGITGPNTTTWTIGATAIVTIVFNGASSKLQINKGSPDTTGTVGSANLGGFTLGAQADGTAPGNIAFQEIAIFSRAPTAAQIAQVVNFEARRWGLSI